MLPGGSSRPGRTSATVGPVDDELEPPLGVVPTEGRGRLPFVLVHGESLLAAASWALTTAGIDLYDVTVPFEDVRESGRDLVVHDPLCPLTPSGFLADAVAESRRTGAVVVGVRPVTDTVKQVLGGPAGEPRLGPTVDRADLVQVTSPVVLPAAVVAGLATAPTDLVALVAQLTRQVPVRHLRAPALGGRVVDEADLEVLAALSEVQHDDPPDDPADDLSDA